ncbi:hypothetical protein PBI_SCTP2_526 [Salicola phage SCTP-2]|nr:hypothetical protein PBI_SCTP2_526 [Salicola phage SCTP-2]
MSKKRTDKDSHHWLDILKKPQ